MIDAQEAPEFTIETGTATLIEPDRVDFDAQAYNPKDEKHLKAYVARLNSIAVFGGNYEVTPLADGTILLTWWRYKEEAE